ncbi:MAG TPA: DUF1003 domain-containing protein [Candidatus Cybelea sp.]|jgi:uncharacterized membrane protein|nr:DUF1003 domain-containing protein [Candidatus Cybelea sp.]
MTQTNGAENHPLVDDVNAEHRDQLSETEKICRRIADATGAPIALLLAILVQFLWIGVGAATHWDPFPFVFLLTCSNVLQLILIFVIAVAQKQQTQHAELRAEADHDSISRLLYHQELQDKLLLRLAQHAGIDVSDLAAQAQMLATSPD